MVDQTLRAIIDSQANICFGCGPGNPVGLQLRVSEDGNRVWAEFEPGRWHEGWAGVVHGGVLAAALDEVMAYCIFYQGMKAVTARMELRYKNPAQYGDHLMVEARITRDSRRLVDIHGKVLRRDLTLVEAAGRFLKLGPLDPSALIEEAPTP
jgi:acyl-coenzyme A thioesterase PaaI-like protein